MLFKKLTSQNKLLNELFVAMNSIWMCGIDQLLRHIDVIRKFNLYLKTSMLIKSSNLGVKNVHLKLNQLLFSFKYMLLYLAQQIIQKLEFFTAMVTPPILTSPAHCFHWATIFCSQLWDHMRLHTMPSVHSVQHRRWILLLTLLPSLLLSKACLAPPPSPEWALSF